MPLDNALMFLVIGIGAAGGLFPSTFAVSCLDLGNCPINGNPLEWMVMPFTELVGDWIYVLIWGMVSGIIYIRTGNPMLVVLIGFLIFAAFLGTSTYAGSSTSQVFQWGFILMAVAFGIVLFILVIGRLRQVA